MGALGLACIVIAAVGDSVWSVTASTARAWFGRSPRRLRIVGGNRRAGHDRPGHHARGHGPQGLAVRSPRRSGISGEMTQFPAPPAAGSAPQITLRYRPQDSRIYSRRSGRDLGCQASRLDCN